MKYTEERKAKQRERAQAATDARKRAEATIIEWDIFIARLKEILDHTSETKSKPRHAADHGIEDLS